MAFTKILPADLTGKGVVGLPDTPGLSTTEMQEKFDEIANDVLVPKHNSLIDELEDSTAAASLGAVDADGNASTIQTEIDNIKAGGYTKDEADDKFLAKIDAASTYLSQNDAANYYVQKEAGKGLSSNDYSTEEKNKLSGIADNANYYELPKSSASTLGGVKPDNTTTTVDENGVIHAVAGGSGSNDYNALLNQPQINSVTLIGDKTSEAFGILRPYVEITTDAGSTVTLTDGVTTITATQVSGSTTKWEAYVNAYGTWTVTSNLPGAGDATQTVTVDAVKKYSVTVNHTSATITVTYPIGATCSISKDSVTMTATGSPYTFTVYQLGTWTVTTVLNGITKTTTVTVSTDGESQSVTVAYASIKVTYDSSFIGKTITCTDSVTTYTKVASSDGNPITFTIPTTGTWVVSGELGGTTYSTNVSVSSLTSYSATLHVFSATVTVTFPYNKGATCSLSDGVTTFNANTSPMSFSVGNTGTWTATVVLDGQTKTASTYVSVDGETKSITVEYGTINVTYEAVFQGVSISCVNGGTTITKTAPSSGSTMVFYPPSTGTWTISGTVSGSTYTTTATVSSLSTAVSANLVAIPVGSTATPTNVIQTWLRCANITNKNYTTVSQVLADSTTLLALISSNNAVDYMVRSTSWANDICANSTAMTDIGANNYCANKLLANSTWCTAICNSTYFESVLNVKVPTMTSNTTPSGTAFANSERGYAYKAFDGDDSTYAANQANVFPYYLGYTFPNASVIHKVYIAPFYQSSQPFVKDFKLQGSNDGFVSDEHDLYSGSFSTSETEKNVVLSNTTAYTSYRLKVENVYNSSGYATVNTLQFYGR